jgi:hypothetical protein
LSGGTPRRYDNSTLRIDRNALFFDMQTPQDGAIAWFDTGGSLVCGNLSMTMFLPRTLVLNHICEVLDLPSRLSRVMGEWRPDASAPHGAGASSDGSIRTVKYYLGDEEITLGQPLVLAGPLTVAAYRAGALQAAGESAGGNMSNTTVGKVRKR